MGDPLQGNEKRGAGLTDAELRASPIDTAVPWVETFRRSGADDGSLPDAGGYPVYDPVNPIVATGVIDTGWLDLRKFPNQFINIIFNVTGVEAYLFNASDDQGNDSTFFGFGSPQLSTVALFPQTQAAPYFDRFFRLIIVNRSGVTATSYTVRSMSSYIPVGPVYQSLDAPVADFFPAPIGQSVTKGRQPDGDYVATPSDGNLFEETTPLGASGSVVIGPYDTDGYKSIEIYIATDQVSATDGIQIEYTPDVQAGVPVYYPGPVYTFSAADIAKGFLIKRLSPALDGFRLTYTNGGTPQGSLFINGTVRNAQTENPSLSIENSVDETQPALSTRGALYAEDADTPGTYSNIQQRGAGLRTSIANHEAETPIKSLSSFKVTRATVTTTPTLVFTPSANCRSWVAKAINTGSTLIYIAESLAKATSGLGYPMDDRDIIGGDLSTGPVYAVSSSGTQALSFFETLL